MKSIRIIIFPKDVQRITGRTDRYARILLQKMKRHFKKDRHQFLSVEEFCSYTGLPVEEVLESLD